LAPGLSYLRDVPLARASFVCTRVGRLFATVSFSLAGSRALSRAALYIYVPKSSAACSGLQATPENLASQRLWPPCSCQVSRSFGTSLLQRRPFCSLWRGGCSQPSHSPSRAPERFRELLSVLHPDSAVASYGLQATPESLASQSLWPSVAPDLPCLRCVLLAKAPFVFALVRRLFTAVSFSLTGSRAFSRGVIYCPG